MRAFRWSASILAILLASAPALAEPATQEGAKALGESFAAYFGRTAVDQGIIAVTPQGEDYKVTVDPQRVIDGLGLPAGSVKLGALSFLTAPQPDGTWKVGMDGFPSVDVHVATPEGEVGGSLALNGYRFEGVYDPKLAAFLTAKGTVDLIDVKWMTQGMEVSLQEAGYLLEMQASDAGGGAVSAKTHHAVKSVVETVKVTPPAKPGTPQAAPISIVYTLGAMTGDGSMEGMRSRAALNLWAFLVGLEGIEHVVEHQDELKTQLLAILPLWSNAEATVSLDGVSAQFPFGSIGLKTLGERLAFSGLTSQGAFELGLKLDGLTLPAPLIPSWSKPLVPTLLDVGFKITIEGLDEIARTLIEDLDLEADPPLSEESQTKLEDMLASGSPKLVIAPSRLTSPSFDISVEGEMALTKPKPSGKITIEADGFDKSLAIVQAAAQSDPKLQQVLTGLTMVKGLAKQSPDGKPSWVLEYSVDGVFTVNGQKMGK
jgi:hypothetical protein